MRRMLLISLLALGLTACGKNNEPPPPTSGIPGAQPESGPRHKRSGADIAADLFSSSCALCHGVSGHGDGQMAANLDPKPRNYSDAAWQATVTDDDLKKIILEGGAAVGKSKMMPGQPSLAKEPEVLDGLVKIIRGFAKPAQ